MKRQLLFLLSLIFLMSCSGSHGLTKKRSGKTPEWVYGIPKEHIVAYGVGATHEEARMQAINKVKEEIIRSVAVQVTINESTTTSEDVNSFFEEYSSSVNIQSEYFEPIKGVSLSKVEEYYWEQFKENKTKKIKYYVKYPFSSAQLNSLISDYNAINASWTKELHAITQNTDYPTFELLLKDIEKLEYLRKKLPNQKGKEAYQRKLLLEEWADDVKIDILENNPGIIRYQLTLYGSPIQTIEKPEVSATCAIEIEKVVEFTDQLIIQYHSDNCSSTRKEYITLSYQLDGYRTRGQFIIAQ